MLGHEGAGIIAEVGEGVTNVKVGDHVIVAWSPPCGECAYCGPRNQPNLCFNIQMVMGGTPHFPSTGQPVFGMAGAGTFAEEMIIPHQGVVKIDDDIPLEIGSLVGCGVMTGVGAAINTAKVSPGSSVVVFGCGGVGISCIMGAKVAGASVIVAVDLNDGKLEDGQGASAPRTRASPTSWTASRPASPAATGSTTRSRPSACRARCAPAYDAIRRGGTACIVGVGKLDEFVSFSAFELFFSEKVLVGSVLRLGRRPHRLPQAARVLQGRVARRSPT